MIDVSGTYDITIEQGATFTRALTWKVDGAAVNLTGYSARMQIRSRASAPDVVVSLTSTNGGITLGGSAGTITLALSATATAAITAGTYRYDLEMVQGSTVTRLLEGSVTVTPEVTR